MANGAGSSTGKSAGIYAWSGFAPRIWHNTVYFDISEWTRICHADAASATTSFATLKPGPVSTRERANDQCARYVYAWLRASPYAIDGRI